MVYVFGKRSALSNRHLISFPIYPRTLLNFCFYLPHALAHLPHSSPFFGEKEMKMTAMQANSDIVLLPNDGPPLQERHL